MAENFSNLVKDINFWTAKNTLKTKSRKPLKIYITSRRTKNIFHQELWKLQGSTQYFSNAKRKNQVKIL